MTTDVGRQTFGRYVSHPLTHVSHPLTFHFMIRTFANKQLRALWETGKSRIDSRMHKRILRRLDALDAASVAEDMNLPGFDFHILQGFAQPRYTVHVNGPWCITFEFRDGDAYVLDFEQYH